jgi:hypothetical protein
VLVIDWTSILNFFEQCCPANFIADIINFRQDPVGRRAVTNCAIMTNHHRLLQIERAIIGTWLKGWNPETSFCNQPEYFYPFACEFCVCVTSAGHSRAAGTMVYGSNHMNDGILGCYANGKQVIQQACNPVGLSRFMFTLTIN